jgi:sugar lactone lactonase YvrE
LREDSILEEFMIRLKLTIGAVWFAVLVGIGLTPNAALATTIPPYVMTDHQTMYTTVTQGAYGVAANARGDVFFADFANNSLDMIPAGSTLPATPTILLTGMNGPQQVTVDKSGNVYVADQLNGKVYRIPFVGGTYATGTTLASITAGGTASYCSATAVLPCRMNPVTLASPLNTDGGFRFGGVAVDGSGNFYVACIYDTLNTGSNVKIFKQTPAGVTTSLLTTYLPALVSTTNAQLASDSAGNLYYTDQVNLYSIPVGATSGTIMNSASLSAPSGVTIDPNTGNLLVSDYGHTRVMVIPYEGTALNFSDQYELLPYQVRSSVGVDAKGTFYYSPANGSPSAISQAQTSVYGVPSLAVNATSTLTFVYTVFNAASTVLNNYSISGHGGSLSYTSGTCTLGSTYTAGTSCAYNVSIKPTRVGPVSGTIMNLDASGNVISQFTLTTIATGSAVAIDPGTAAAIGSSSYTKPAGVAVDKAGNVFIADTTANAVYELVGGTGTAVSLGSGLSGPTGVAVDAAGDLFIADTGNSRVVEIPVVGTVLSTANQIVVVTGLTAPLAIATGPLNSLYIAQSGSLALYENRGYIAPTKTAVISTAYTSPRALAVDPSGNIFIADSTLGKVIELANNTYATTTIASGLTMPTGLVTDADGDLFLVDNGTGTVVRIPNLSGTLTYGSAVSMGSFTSPYGIGIDEAGNLYLSSQATTPAIYEVTRTTGALNFGTVANNVTSSAQTATLVSRGNTALTLGATVEAYSSGDSTHFTPSTTCTSSGSLAAGSSCNISATFTPTGPGTDTEVLALSASPTVTTSPFTLTLTGSGTSLPSTTTTIGTISPSSPTYGQAVTVPVTVTGSSPTGNVALSVDGTLYATQALSSAATSFNVTGLTAATHALSAVYAGDTNNAGSTGTGSVTVTAASQTITGFSPASSYTDGSGTVTLSATASSGLTVVFTNDASSTATCSVSSTTLTISGSGICVIDANQAGNTGYNAATQVQATINVSKGSQSITGFAPPATATYGSGTITLSATGGASGNAVTFSVLSGPGTVSGTNGSTLTITGVGTIEVAADEAGSGSYTAATEATANIVVSKGSQTITFTQPGSPVALGVSPIALSASSTSGLTVSFSVLSGPGTITGGTNLTVTGVGTIVVACDAASNADYTAATEVQRSVTVNAASSSTSLSTSLASVVPGQSVTLTATVSSGSGTPTGTVTFTATSTGATQGTLGTATLVNGVASYYGLIWGGTDTVTAIYNGDSNYGGSTSNAVTVANFPIAGLQFNWPFINWAQGVSYGANSGAWPVTLQNLTGATVTPTINIVNSNFVISGSNCGTLAQGATCSFNVTFSPTSGGSATGTKITSALTATAGASTVSIPVSGIAVSSALTFNWPFLNFTPTVAVGATSTPWPVTMTNSSGTTTTVNSIGFSDASFAVTSDTCTSQTLGAGASCTFNVTFSPIAADITQSGTNVISGVTMTASGNSGAVTGTLSAGGWAAAALGFNWPFVTFQNQPIGSTGTNLWPVTVTNYSGTTVSGLSYNFTGVTNYQSGAFTLTNTCPSLAPGGSCTFYIAPSPVSGQSAGAYSAALVVSGSGLSSPALSVSGSATASGYSINWNQDQQAGVSTIDFGPQNVKNVTAGPWPITVFNNTGSAETVSLTPSLAVYTTDVPTLTIAAGGSGTFNLYFTPTVDQCYSGTLTVSDGTNSYTFNTWGGANK